LWRESFIRAEMVEVRMVLAKEAFSPVLVPWLGFIPGRSRYIPGEVSRTEPQVRAKELRNCGGAQTPLQLHVSNFPWAFAEVYAPSPDPSPPNSLLNT
jgi:hypothetical protein